MQPKIPHKHEAVPVVRGRPLLIVTCTTCDALTVARSPDSETVRGWSLLPNPWPWHLPQWARVPARCPACTYELSLAG